ncbi:MAG: VanZ family protein [Lachnospiraceae bacterium]|nr:VanZ family protein [Lachnospiraceae bacterium]
MVIPEYEFLTDRQIEKAVSYAQSLFRITPFLITLLVLWGIYVLSALIFFRNEKTKPYVKTRRAVCCILYYLTILYLCVLNRDKGDSYSLSLVPFQWVYNGRLHESEVVEAILNVGIFIPFSMILYGYFRYIWASAMAVLLGGLAVELLQYVTMRGTFSTENLICYFLGGMVGIMLMYIGGKLRHLARSKHKK